MTISALTPRKVADYIRVDYDQPAKDMPQRDDFDTEEEYEEALAEWKEENAGYLDLMDEVQMLMDAATDMIVKHTGRTVEYIGAQRDLVYPFLAEVGEMWENRQLRNEKGAIVNEYALSAIDAHSINLIPGEAEEVNA